jgi:osmoprotectant transport system permease protein
VGATSFGNYIFTGLQTRNLVSVTVGSIAAAAMAIGLDLFIGGIQWLAENAAAKKTTAEFKRVKGAVIIAAVAAVIATAYTLRPTTRADYIVGGKGFTEQYILAGLLSAELEAAGFKVDQRLGMGSEVIYAALANNAIDVYVEYSGTIWANIMGKDDNPGSLQVQQQVSDYVQNTDRLVNIGPLGFRNLYAFAMTKQRAEELGVTSIDDLVPIADRLIAAGDLEFFGRPEWATVSDTYSLDFAEKLTFDVSLMYSAVADGQVDVISAYSTDGRIAAYDLVLLDDPKNALLPYDSLLLASENASNDPKLMSLMTKLALSISDREMQQANKIVDVDGGTVSEAVSFLREIIHR